VSVVLLEVRMPGGAWYWAIGAGGGDLRTLRGGGKAGR